MKNLLKQHLVPYLWITLASAVYAVGFNWCYEPNQIGFGGITGLGQIIIYLLPWAPIGTVVIILNVPLFILGWKFLGGHILISSLYAMFISSVAIDLLHLVYQFQPMDPMLACIFGGVLMGGSLGIVFLQGATTGGTDLVARLLKLRFSWLPMGKILLAVDLSVILAVAAVFGNLSSALYGIVALYLSSFVMDKALYGLDNAKVAYIISDSYEAITQALIHDIDRGVTILHGQGGWSGAEKKVLMVAFKQKQIVEIKRMVNDIDPHAFLVVCDAHEVLGDGFRAYQENDI